MMETKVMDKLKSPFEIIDLIADDRVYVPDEMEDRGWFAPNWVHYGQMQIPLGQSRYGGCAMDLPPDLLPPQDMPFAGQVDLAVASQYDKSGLLPKTGQLIFFADITKFNTGYAYYYDVPNDQLQRIVIEHEDNFYAGVLIASMKSDVEKASDYYKIPTADDFRCLECGAPDLRKCNCPPEIREEQLAELNIHSTGEMWNCREGQHRSKMLGIYSDCQDDEDDFLNNIESGRINLFQIGENGFNMEGMFSVSILIEDLKNRNFTNCDFNWSQT